MSEIPDIQVRNIGTYQIPVWAIQQPSLVPLPAPVTVQIGFPIVDLPGCVEWHPDDKRAANLPIEDANGVRTLCPHGQYPSFNAMDYSPHDLVYTSPAKPPSYQQPKTPPPVPETKIPETKEDVECPAPNSPRIGDIAQNKKEKVSGYELNKEGTICIILYEDIGIAEQFLPAPQLVTTTAAIAAVATTSALLAKPLADLLLKVVKPAVKKAIGAIQKKLGQTPYRPTRAEIAADRYREKRGLLPLKKGFSKKSKEKK